VLDLFFDRLGDYANPHPMVKGVLGGFTAQKHLQNLSPIHRREGTVGIESDEYCWVVNPLKPSGNKPQ
jgi:hypothetical protein